jgi:hypothetical protein
MCSELPDLAATVLAQTAEDGLTHPVLADLAKRIQARARACAALFA